MEITEHQANMLRALADKKTLQFREVLPEGSSSFAYEYANIHDLGSALLFINSDKYEVRIKPDVIIVNGIEVPAGVTKAPADGYPIYTASPGHPDWISSDYWRGEGSQEMRLARGLVYTDRTACELRSKAMAAHMPG